MHLGTNQKSNNIPVLNLGFRPFFLGAGIFAILSITGWFLFYVLGVHPPIGHINTYQWHAHEMIYGYSLAVIAGFLLTATRTWTGIQTLYGIPLLFLVLLWFMARLFIFFGLNYLAGISDFLFIALLSLAILIPIVMSKQWKQLAIIAKLISFAILNSLFYLGILGFVDNGIYLGIYGGLYLVIGLILMLGRRVIPFFIEKGVGSDVKLYNSKVLDFASLIVFLIFFIAEVFQVSLLITSYSALLIGIVNIIRLIGWYTNGIWKKPLLWSLYLAMWSISLGFILYYFSYIFEYSKFIAIHALSYGGIGLITIGMMARVSLGHTGRNIHQPPAKIVIAFIIMLLGSLFRVFFPLILPEFYILWMSIAMLCWVIAFLIFICSYFIMLVSERRDGEFG